MRRQLVTKSNYYRLIKSIFILGGLLLLFGESQINAEAHPVQGNWSRQQAARHLFFIENRGQIDQRVNYYLQGQEKTLYFTPTGVTLALSGSVPIEDSAERWVVKQKFVGGSAQPVGQDQMETVVSYFRGARDRWHTGLPTYAGLLYPDLWPGVDLVYMLKGDQLKYQFTIRPGADLADIRLAYHGATNVRLTTSGQLEVSTPVGSFHDTAPLAYQVIDGYRLSVDAAYTQVVITADGTYEYGFRLGAYDPTRPLILDPAVILYAGFIGGSQRENGYSVAVDADGFAYITGETHSIADFPAVAGPDLSHNGGPYNGDAFIAKVRADGTGLVYAGFIGGSGEDYGYGVAVDANGYAYISGKTTSADFPVTPGAYGTVYNGGGDAFVAKVEANGSGLVYATYIGDAVSFTTSDSGEDIAVNGRNAYVLVNTSFGPFGGYDTSVVKLNAAGSALDYVEYIGGSSDDKGNSLAVDASGFAYVTGETSSNNFPSTPGAYDTGYNGGGDAFVAKVDNDGTGLEYATYIGDVVLATTIDSGEGIGVDGTGSAYVLVNTSFGPFGSYDTSVVKLNAAGSALDYVRYIGGSGTDFGSDLALDDQGHAYITGNTTSSLDFPTTNWLPVTYDAPQEAFAAKVRVDGSGLVYAGFIAGSGTGSAGITVDSAGNAYVTGTNWRGEDFPAVIGPDIIANGERDAFVVKISPLRYYLPLIFKSAAGA